MKSKSGNINYPVLYFWNTVCGKWLTQGWINKISIHGKWLTQGWINKISIHGKWLTQGWINKISIHGKWLTQSWIGKIIQDIPILKKNKIKIKLQCFIQTFMVNKPFQVFPYVYAMKYPNITTYKISLVQLTRRPLFTKWYLIARQFVTVTCMYKIENIHVY